MVSWLYYLCRACPAAHISGNVFTQLNIGIFCSCGADVKEEFAVCAGPVTLHGPHCYNAAADGHSHRLLLSGGVPDTPAPGALRRGGPSFLSPNMGISVHQPSNKCAGAVATNDSESSDLACPHGPSVK